MGALRVFLCQFAAANPDGTHTFVRAGIDRLSGPVPMMLEGYLVVESPDDAPIDGHSFSVVVTLPDGSTALKLEHVLPPKIETFSRVIVPLKGPIMQYGEVRVTASVGSRSGLLTVHATEGEATA